MNLVDSIIDISVPVIFFIAFIIALVFLLSPFLIIKYAIKRKFNWWIIILCFITSFGIYQAEVWAWWKYWEWAFEKIGEGLLHTF